MRILHTVELYSPSVGGIQEVVKQISERLVKLGHDITVATSKLPNRKSNRIKGVNIKEFDISGNLVRGIEGEKEKYKKYLINSEFDIITNFAAQQWASDIMLTIVDKIHAKKVFVPTGFSGLYLPEYKIYFKEMKKYMKKYDANVFLSNNYRDINFARNNNVKNIILIPNGASEEEFLKDTDIDIRDKLKIPRNNFLLLHVGSHTTVKGHSEAIEIFNRAKINNCTFLMIANETTKGCKKKCRLKKIFSNLKFSFSNINKNIIITSLPRKETVAAYKEADLFLFPSNIECSPIVLFECMASKTPFITTDVGNSSEIIEWSGSGQLLPTTKIKDGYSIAKIDDSVKIFEELFLNKNKRKKMADKGYKAWTENFKWGKIAEKYEGLYNSLLE